MVATSQQPAPPEAPPCPGCNRPRVFEVQLLPRTTGSLTLRPGSLQASLSADLTPEVAGLYDPLEFATVLLWTCPVHCSGGSRESVMYAEEFAGVQADPVAVALHERTRQAPGV